MAVLNFWESRGVYRQADGVLNGSELLQSVIEVEGDSRFDEIRYVINDFSMVSEFKISNADILAISAMDKASAYTNSNIKIALVTGEHQLEEIYSQYNNMFETPPYPNRLFRTLEEARLWVEVPIQSEMMS